MSDAFEIRINGNPMLVDEYTSVSVALLRAGHSSFRLSVTGEPRGPVCGMGICAECGATINGVPGQLTCQRLCTPGMTIETAAWL